MFQDYLKGFRECITEGDANNGICYDGVVNKDSYDSKKQKLMFLLKETNGNKNNGQANEKNEDWNYMEWVNKQAKREEPLYRSVFRNIAMWSKIFQVHTEEKRIAEFEDCFGSDGTLDSEKICESMQSISIINLKKSWGTGSTDRTKLNDYLNDEKYLGRKNILLYQVKTLSPSVVLCGGTFDFAKEIFGNGVELKKIQAEDGLNVEYFKSGSSVFVNCYHPSRPFWSRMNSFKYINEIFSIILK